MTFLDCPQAIFFLSYDDGAGFRARRANLMPRRPVRQQANGGGKHPSVSIGRALDVNAYDTALIALH